MKRAFAILLCLALRCAAACAEIAWPDSLTSAQAALRNYVENVNLTLTEMGAGVIDMQYELYSGFASLGLDGADTPDTAEMYFLLGEDSLHSLTLRLCDADRFERVAAACLHGASPTAIPLEDAQTLTASYADVMRQDQAGSTMTHSFEEDVSDLQGSQPRAYFAYYPNQYGDGRSWLQMTLIFARPGSEDAALSLTGATPAPMDTDSEDVLSGFFSQDNYTHLEVFATPTPEPDSAAMEDW